MNKMMSWKSSLEDYLQSAVPKEASAKENFFAYLNIAIFVMMGLYAFINPLSLASIKEICYYLSILALIILLIFRKTDFSLRFPLTVPLALFFLWAAIGLFFTLDFQNTLHDLRGHLLEHLIVFFLLANFYLARNRLEALSVLLIVSAMIFSIGGLILFYGIEGHTITTRFGKTFKEMYIGFMCFTTVFAAVLSLHRLHKTRSNVYRLLYFLSFLTLTAATLLNQSRGALIGLGVALIILCLDKKKNLIFVAVALALLIFMPGMKDRLESQGMTQDIRVSMFRLSWEVIKDSPVYGVGFGGEIYSKPHLVDLKSYNAKLPQKYQQEPWRIITSTHNTFLDVAIRTGLVGLALFGLIAMTALWMLWDVFRRRKEDFYRSWAICLLAGYLSFMAQAVFTDALYGPQATVMYVNLAMIAVLWKLAGQNNPAPQEG
ncbi:MAG: O-antigen ligase family protein [Smithellaceae bacterium]